MNTRALHLIAAAILLGAMSGGRMAFGQAETVPTSHPVYTFLKRMEVKRLIERYHDAVLPLSRREVAGLLSEAKTHSDRLSTSEQGWLGDFLSEFAYDISGSTERIHSLIGSPEPTGGDALAATLSDREKYLYAYTDSSVTFFVNGLFETDARRISGAALGSQHSEYMQLGGRIRGTMFGRLGYYYQASNAQFWGSRDLLLRDPLLAQSYALTAATNAQNFDFSDGYVRYDGGIISVQLGRERVLWGTGYDQKMLLSDNIRTFDFVRADAEYKSFRYSFLHGWLLGRSSELRFMVPGDTTYRFTEPVIADKYVAVHRFGLSFPEVLDFGFQEIYIYSNRSVDLAYLNPLIMFEPVQRSRGERDNGFWAFDIQTHFLRNVEVTASILYDDINVPDMFGSKWTDRYAWQVGAFYADPFSIPNSSLMVEYTRVEPYVFSHSRSRDNSYTSLDALLGSTIGSNADAWFFRYDILPLRNLFLSFGVQFGRRGDNILDSAGVVIKNVGGDVLFPHRETDPEMKRFLDGSLVKTRRVRVLATYEAVNQLWLDARFEHEFIHEVSADARKRNTTYGVRLRFEF